jgi:hypothetical protein
MSETPQRLVERLRDEGQKTCDFFRSLTPEQLEQTLYSDGSQWKVGRLIAHFVSTEAGIAALIESILAGGSGVPDNFDIDAFNERQVDRLGTLSTPELVEQFDRFRQQTIALVEGMSESDLKKAGRHPFLGVTPVEEMIKLLYRHTQIHQRDVRRLGGAGSST